MITNLNTKIPEVIEKFKRKIYIIQKDDSVKCSCVSKTSGQPDSNCKLCLGLGSKIKIRKIYASIMDTQVPATVRPDGKFIVSTDIYVDKKYNLQENDVAIIDSNAYIIYKIKRNYGFNGQHTYDKCLSSDDVADEKVFVENFFALIKDVKKHEQ